MLSRDVRQQSGDGLSMGEVACGDRDRGAEFGQFGDQLVGVGGFGSAAADQQQVPHPVPGDHVCGYQPAQCSGSTCDQYGALGVETGTQLPKVDRPGRRVGGWQAGQPGGVQVSLSQGELRFPGGHCGGNRTKRCGSLIDIQQNKPAGVFCLSRTDHSPQRRVGKVTSRFVFTGGYRPAGHHHQPCVGQSISGQPFPQCSQQPLRGGMYRNRRSYVFGVVGSAGHHHAARPVHLRRQRRNVWVDRRGGQSFDQVCIWCAEHHPTVTIGICGL
jgi:hypothetical protein